jgi:hypothetical protein
MTTASLVIFRIVASLKSIPTPTALRARINNSTTKLRGGVWTRAKAIFYFLKDSHSAGIFWKIVKLCIKDMSWWDETRTVLELTGMVVAAFFTDGAALIARFALAVDDAVYVGQKIGNLMAFENMKPRMTIFQKIENSLSSCPYSSSVPLNCKFIDCYVKCTSLDYDHCVSGYFSDCSFTQVNSNANGT